MSVLGAIVRTPLWAAAKVAGTPVGAVPQQTLRALTRPGGRGPLREAVDGRVVLLTGASAGIGEATALRLAAAGAHVVLVARRVERLEDVRDRIVDRGGTAEIRPCDLNDLEAVDAMAEAVLADHGVVDVLVNNAGRSIRRPISRSYDRFHDFERTMQLNYFAAVRLIVAVLPGMRERGRGHVVNISSAGVQAKPPRFGAYLASKAALDTFSDCVAGEVAKDGVRFTTVHMPLVRTEMIEATDAYDDAPALSPREAADLVAQAIAYRPRRVGPLYGVGAAVAETLTPELAGFVRSAAYRLGWSG